MLLLFLWRRIEKVGFVVEVSGERCGEVMAAYRAAGVEAREIGKVTNDGKVSGRHDVPSCIWHSLLIRLPYGIPPSFIFESGYW